MAERETLIVRREEPSFLPGGEDAAGGVERRSSDVCYVLAPQRELDRRSVYCAVPSLAGEPQHRMGDAAYGALSGKLAHPFLHLLKTLTDDADNVNADLRMLVGSS